MITITTIISQIRVAAHRGRLANMAAIYPPRGETTPGPIIRRGLRIPPGPGVKLAVTRSAHCENIATRELRKQIRPREARQRPQLHSWPAGKPGHPALW